MKKPKWAKLRRYKVVRVTITKSGIPKPIYQSVMVPVERAKHCSGKGKGIILTYRLGTVQTSPNGLCLNPNHTCGRGIHAWRTKAIAQYEVQYYFGSAILSVWAAKWVGTGRKQRAYRVWVGRVKCIF